MHTATWECPQICNGVMLQRGINQSGYFSFKQFYFFFPPVFSFVSFFFFLSCAALVHIAMLMLNKCVSLAGQQQGLSHIKESLNKVYSEISSSADLCSINS